MYLYRGREIRLVVPVAGEGDSGLGLVVHGNGRGGGPHAVGALVLPLEDDSVVGVDGGLERSAGPLAQPGHVHVARLGAHRGRDGVGLVERLFDGENHILVEGVAGDGGGGVVNEERGSARQLVAEQVVGGHHIDLLVRNRH